MDKDIEKVLEEFDREFYKELMNYGYKAYHELVKTFLLQALETEKAKREAMVREMIGEEVERPTGDPERFAYDKEWYTGHNDKRQELIKIAKKYGVEV